MKKLACVMAMTLVAAGVAWGSIYDQDDFSSYTPGNAPGGSWSSANAEVSTADGDWAGDGDVYDIEVNDGAATNTITATPGSTKVWTQFAIKPAFGVGPDADSYTNQCSFLMYFPTNGLLEVWNGSDWTTCSNDIWGNASATITGDTWQEISICQNFDTKKAAIFRNGTCLVQDLPWPDPGQGDYDKFVVGNQDGTARVDYVSIANQEFDALFTQLDVNESLNPLDDFAEIQANGHLARTLYADGGTTAPHYATVTGAVAACRAGDVINIAAGMASDSITLDGGFAYTFTGAAYTAALFQVNSGSTVTFNQNIEATTLTANGNVTMASGNLDATSASVSASVTLALGGGTGTIGTISGIGAGGQITVASGGALDVTTLAMNDEAAIVVTSGSFDYDQISMTGSFTINGSDLNATGIAVHYPYHETWENFNSGQKVNQLGFAGWGATADGVQVMANGTNAAAMAATHVGTGWTTGSKAVILPDGTTVSNLVATSSQAYNDAGGSIWTDYYIKPSPGAAPSGDQTGAFVCFVNTNNYLEVYTNATSTYVCDTGADAANHDAQLKMYSDKFSRVTVHMNFNTKKFAVIVNGVMVKDQLSFANTGATLYSSFVAQSPDGESYLDDVDINYGLPDGLSDFATYAQLDLDGDGFADAWEVQNFPSLAHPFGTIFKFL
jgi:hypothetical protein